MFQYTRYVYQGGRDFCFLCVTDAQYIVICAMYVQQGELYFHFLSHRLERNLLERKRKETCQHDHFPFNSKEKENLVEAQ